MAVRGKAWHELKWLRFRKFSQRNCIYPPFSFFLFPLSRLVLGHNDRREERRENGLFKKSWCDNFICPFSLPSFLPLVVNTLCYSSETWIWLTLGLRKGGFFKFSIFKKGYFSIFYIYNFSFCYNKTDNIINHMKICFGKLKELPTVPLLRHKSWHLLRTFYMPGTLARALCISLFTSHNTTMK